jgi:hypothetical protein
MTYPPLPQYAGAANGGGLDVEIVPDSDPPAPEVEPLTVEFHGQRFPIRDAGVPLASMMELAVMAKRQQQGGDEAAAMEMLVILHELLQLIITVDAWDAFWQHAKRVGADNDDFQAVIAQAVEARSGARPIQPSSGSPGGRSTTAPNSAGGSSVPGSSIRLGDSRVQTSLEARGRPDLALVVQRAREASTGS